jgi:hypothetical protein
LHEGDLSEYVSKLAASREETGNANAKQETEKLKARCAELDRIIKKLLEQNALGAISDERFITLSGEYEAEEIAAKTRISELQGLLSKQNSDAENAKRFCALLRNYTEFSELSVSVLNDLIDRIVIHNAVGKYKERTQKVEIYYRFMGMNSEVTTSSL